MPLTFWVRRGNECQRGGEREGECIGIGEKEDVIYLCLDPDPGSDVFVCLKFLVIFFFLFFFDISSLFFKQVKLN